MVIPDERAWQELFNAALVEPDPESLVASIQAARTAILDRMQERVSKPPTSEHIAMRDALTTLDSLAKVAKRDLGRLGDSQT